MDIIAWDKINDKAIVPERLPNDGEWARFTDGNRVTFREHNVPVSAPVNNVKLVGMGELGELIPAAVLVELEDFKRLSSTAAGKRQAATRVLTRINSNVAVDVLHADFTTLVGQLVTHTSLTQPEADGILSTLQGV